MASLLLKCLGAFPPGVSEMINWPHALIIWGWCLHQHCANWVPFSSQKPHASEAGRLELLCLMKLEIRLKKKKKKEPLGFPSRGLGRPKEANSLSRESPCSAGCDSPEGFPRAGVTCTGTPTISVPLEASLTNFSLGTQMGKHGDDCTFTCRCLYIWRNVCVVVVDERDAKSSQTPFSDRVLYRSATGSCTSNLQYVFT